MISGPLNLRSPSCIFKHKISEVKLTNVAVCYFYITEFFLLLK